MSESLFAVPKSSATVEVSCIDTKSTIRGPTSKIFAPHLEGVYDEIYCPCLSFLIKHVDANGTRSFVFDLGIRKDPESLSPTARKGLDVLQLEIVSTTSVRDIIGQTPVEGLILSHQHFDHVGDPSTFGSETSLVVGPGFVENYLPGYPTNPDSPILEADYAGREIREIVFDDTLTIAGYRAYDFFGDASFFLLDCPGHAFAHMMGLARTTEDTFVVMGADVCHHGGEFRPSGHRPLPDQIFPNPLQQSARYPRHLPCPGSLFTGVHPKGSSTESFFKATIVKDEKDSDESIEKLQLLDASSNVLVIIAHDSEVPRVIDLYPKPLNAWKEHDWKEKLQWMFLNDFKVE